MCLYVILTIISQLFSQFSFPSPPLVNMSLFSACMTPFLFCKYIIQILEVLCSHDSSNYNQNGTKVFLSLFLPAYSSGFSESSEVWQFTPYLAVEIQRVLIMNASSFALDGKQYSSWSIFLHLELWNYLVRPKKKKKRCYLKHISLKAIEIPNQR